MFESFLQDIRYALRNLRRSPGFTAVAVAMLAVGIGVNAAVFTVTNATLFKGFPLVYRNDRLVYMMTGVNCCVSYPDFQDWRAQAKSFVGMAIVHGTETTIDDRDGFPESYDATEISADTFKLVGQKPFLGRDLTPADEVPGAQPVVILSYGYWQQRYAGDPRAIGRTVYMNGAPATVIGVMPRGFSFPQKVDVWVPLVRTPEVMRRDNRNTWFVLGRMADGVTIERAHAEMETIGRRLATAYPLTDGGPNAVPRVFTFREFIIGRNATMVYYAMMGAVGFVLLIACANLANLLLARAVGRSREISVRIALGAGRWRILRQLLIESMMLAAAGGALGWWIAGWGVRIYGLAANGPGISDAIVGTWFDNVLDYSMDYRAVAYLAAISIVTGLIFGLAPAARLSKLDVNHALKDGGRSATGGGRQKHLSALLVAGEMALAIVLLAGAGVMIRSFLNVYKADMGVKSDNVVTALLNLPRNRYPRPADEVAFYKRLQSRLAAIPGVESVAIANTVPAYGAPRMPYELAGAPAVDEQSRARIPVVTAGPGYFHTLGAAVLSGRDFTDFDEASATPAAIVNRQFANRYWPGENPLGKRIRLFNGTAPQAWRTVIGVASDIVQNDITRQEFQPVVYLPYSQAPVPGFWIFARTRVPAGALNTPFRREIRAVDAALPWRGPYSLTGWLMASYQYRGISGTLFLIFAVIALLLASIGLYAVVAHSVTRRTQEIGIRMAMGATAGDVLRLVFLQGIVPAGAGLAAGVAASLAVNRVLQSSLVHVSPADPVTYLTASTILILSAVLGCVIPARRAMRVDPVAALRHE